MDTRKLTMPDKGYHVVGRDSFEPPGEQLYLIAVCDTREEAERALKEHKEENPNEVDGEKVKVYGPPGDR